MARLRSIQQRRPVLAILPLLAGCNNSCQCYRQHHQLAFREQHIILSVQQLVFRRWRRFKNQHWCHCRRCRGWSRCGRRCCCWRSLLLPASPPQPAKPGQCCKWCKRCRSCRRRRSWSCSNVNRLAQSQQRASERIFPPEPARLCLSSRLQCGTAGICSTPRGISAERTSKLLWLRSGSQQALTRCSFSSNSISSRRILTASASWNT
jgi:hypothetical protein